MDDAVKARPEDSVLVMYSGGLDSTLLAAMLAGKFRRMFLVTYDLPYTVGLDNCRKNIEKIKKVDPNCEVTHHIIDLAGTRKIFFDDFYADYFKYCKGGAPGIICFSCRMAMLIESIKFCLQNGIGHLAVGNTKVQANKAHSFPGIVKRFADFMARYGIVYTNPVYGVESREKEEELLKEFGMDVGKNIGLSSVTNQPRCLLGIYSTLWLLGNPLVEKDMIEYFEDKVPLMERYLSEFEPLKGKIKSRQDLRTPIDETEKGGWVHEFGPLMDRVLSVLLTPLWWLSQIYFRLRSGRGIKK